MGIVKTLDAAFGAVRGVCDDWREAPVFSTGTGLVRFLLGGLEIAAGVPLSVKSMQRKSAFEWINLGLQDLVTGPLEAIPVVSNEIWQRVNGIKANAKKLEREKALLEQENAKLRIELDAAKEEHRKKYAAAMEEIRKYEKTQEEILEITNRTVQ